MRLHDQYTLLYQHYADHDAQPGLPLLATLLGCSERNIRQQLSKMQARGWLHWAPGCGRGKRSTLTLLFTPEQLQLDKLGELVARGELEKAFVQLDTPQRRELMARLPDFLGAAKRNRQLRIPLHRAPTSLDPLHASSRLESHLVRQLFDRLCSFDRQQQTLSPNLAHYWEASDDGSRWRFWLRPGLRFHDGQPLDATAVAATVLRLRDAFNPWQRQYRHLVNIELHDTLSLSFVLAETDWLWPNRLATANASIVPIRRGADFSRLPVGSGPFRLIRHNELRLSLAAHEHYHRERPLLDQIDLWVITTAMDPPFDLLLDASAISTDSPLLSACTYLLCNPSRLRLGAPQRANLMRFLAEPSLVKADDPLRKPAQGLLTEWEHRLPTGPARCPLVKGSTLTLACYELASFQPLAAALAERLASAGIRLIVRTLSYPEFERLPDWWPDTDLVLSSEVPSDDRDYSCHEWFGSNPVLRAALEDRVAAELDQSLMHAQRQTDSAKRMRIYKNAGDCLVGGGWILPLSHERQGVSANPAVAGLELGASGWMDFSTLWVRQ
ncbi:ABC transporter substrate-binding protein [Paludibacterium yongneupense]|uniref:ABC transporter substrate-binding protein n=1 Tax=Paludibacterium yongneupense TaxID=400061 RepID=UPI00041861CB|nr:ABC transporter substrate-binding protein [Paludibacterium yongneupense]